MKKIEIVLMSRITYKNHPKMTCKDMLFSKI